MSPVLRVKVNESTRKELSALAGQSGLSAESLAGLVLQGFIEGKGKVYVGAWKEGPGIRVLPDWPRFSSVIFKIKSEELK